MNLMLIRIGESYLMIDCGVQFPDPSNLGVEKLLPNIEFLSNIKNRLIGIVLTHGHEDHIGALRWVLEKEPVPIMGTRFTLELVREKLREFDLGEQLDCREIKPGDKVDLAEFKLRFLSVTHSIPGCVAVAVETEQGHIVHTGDYRIDPSPADGIPFDSQGFAELGQEGVALLLSDSTNALVPGHTMSEAAVGENLEELIKSWKGRVIVTLFSSNLYRVSSIFKIAQKVDRTLCLVGRSLETYIQVGRATTKLDLPDPDTLPSLSDSLGIPNKRMLIVCTGSQAEPRSALVQAASGNHKSFVIGEGDLVLFSSRVIPGNERRVHRMINLLMRQGAQCITRNKKPIHASGHAKRDELAEMLKLTTPKFFVPIHGEYSFLQGHRKLAEAHGDAQSKVITNGDVLELEPSGLKVIARVDATPFYDDGATIGTAEEIKLHEKRKMAWNGAVSAHIKLREDKSYQVSIQSGGLFSNEGQLDLEAEKAISLDLGELPSTLPPESFLEQATQITKRFYRKRFHKRPLVFVRVERY